MPGERDVPDPSGPPLIDEVAPAAVSFAADGSIHATNIRFAQLFDLVPADLIGKKLGSAHATFIDSTGTGTGLFEMVSVNGDLIGMRRHTEPWRWFQLSTVPVDDVLTATLTDVTAHRNEAERHARSEHQLQAILQQSGIGFVRLDAAAMPAGSTPSGCDPLGLTVELADNAFDTIIHPKDRHVFAGAFRDALGGRDVTTDLRVLGRDGVVWTRLTISGHSSVRDGTTAVVVSYRDITSEKAAEEVAGRYRERLAAALAASDTGSIVVDVPTQQVVWIQEHSSLTGDADPARVHSVDSTWLHPEDRTRVAELAAEVQAEPGSQRSVRVRGRDDDRLPWRVIDLTLVHAPGEDSDNRVLLTYRDITDTIEQVAELTGSQRRLLAVMRHAGLRSIICDTDGYVIWPEVATDPEVYGQRLVGHRVTEWLDAEDGELFLNSLRTASSTRRPVRIETRGIQRARWYEVTVDDLTDDPEIGGVLMLYRDIHERKLAEVEAADADTRLAALEQAGVVALMVLDTNGNVMWSPAGLAGRHEFEVGTAFVDAFSVQDRTVASSLVVDVVTGERPERHASIRLVDGSWADVVVRPVQNLPGGAAVAAFVWAYGRRDLGSNGPDLAEVLQSLPGGDDTAFGVLTGPVVTTTTPQLDALLGGSALGKDLTELLPKHHRGRVPALRHNGDLVSGWIGDSATPLVLSVEPVDDEHGLLCVAPVREHIDDAADVVQDVFDGSRVGLLAIEADGHITTNEATRRILQQDDFTDPMRIWESLQPTLLDGTPLPGNLSNGGDLVLNVVVNGRTRVLQISSQRVATGAVVYSLTDITWASSGPRDAVAAVPAVLGHGSGGYVYVTRNSRARSGWRSGGGDIAGLNIFECVAGQGRLDDQERHRLLEAMASVRTRRDQVVQLTIRVDHDGGTTHHIDVVVRSADVRDAGGELLVTWWDVTDHLDARERIDQLNQQLRAAHDEAAHARRSERDRIAAVLHRDALQTLAVSRWYLESALAAEDPILRRQTSEQSVEAYQHTIDVIRAMVNSLNPAELGVGTLAHTITAVAETFGRTPVMVAGDAAGDHESAGEEVVVDVIEAMVRCCSSGPVTFTVHRHDHELTVNAMGPVAEEPATLGTVRDKVAELGGTFSARFGTIRFEGFAVIPHDLTREPAAPDETDTVTRAAGRGAASDHL